VQESWRIVQPVLDTPPPIHLYESATWGPVAAERLAERWGGWHDPS
jgi:glucose-6-phosphate 1-dehydrogenase